MLKLSFCSLRDLPEGFFGEELSIKEKQSLLGRYLAEKLVSGLSGIPEDELIFQRDHRGKPFFKDVPFFFSIGHSEELVVCAVSDSPVGADLQKIKPVSYALAKGVFSEEERTDLFDTACRSKEEVESFSQSDLLQEWYALWCKKEALGKFYGTGLSRELLNAPLAPMLKKEGLLCSEVFIKEGFCCAVVAKEAVSSAEKIKL